VIQGAQGKGKSDKLLSPRTWSRGPPSGKAGRSKVFSLEEGVLADHRCQRARSGR